MGLQRKAEIFVLAKGRQKNCHLLLHGHDVECSRDDILHDTFPA